MASEKDLPKVKAELHRLNDENLQMANLLNSLADFIEEISVDFSNFTFKDDAREEWRKWCTAYVNRPCQVKIMRCLDCGAPFPEHTEVCGGAAYPKYFAEAYAAQGAKK